MKVRRHHEKRAAQNPLRLWTVQGGNMCASYSAASVLLDVSTSVRQSTSLGYTPS